MKGKIQVYDSKRDTVLMLSPAVWAMCKKTSPHLTEVSQSKMPEEIQKRIIENNEKLNQFLAEVQIPEKKLEDMTLDELKAIAKTKDIRGFGRMTKEKLIEKLTKLTPPANETKA